MGGLFS